MKGAKVLPDCVRNAIIAQEEEEAFPEDARKGQRDVSKEDIRGSVEVLVPVEDVRDECVNCVEGLAAWLACTLGRCEKIEMGGFAIELR